MFSPLTLTSPVPLYRTPSGKLVLASIMEHMNCENTAKLVLHEQRTTHIEVGLEGSIAKCP